MSKDILNTLLTAGPRQWEPIIAIPSPKEIFSIPCCIAFSGLGIISVLFILLKNAPKTLPSIGLCPGASVQIIWLNTFWKVETNGFICFRAWSAIIKIDFPVIPNDEIVFKVKYINHVKSIYKFSGEAKRGSERICEAIFSAMIIDKN